MTGVQDLGKITLASAPTKGKTLDEYEQNVERWARDVERTVRTLEATIRAILATLP